MSAVGLLDHPQERFDQRTERCARGSIAREGDHKATRHRPVHPSRGRKLLSYMGAEVVRVERAEPRLHREPAKRLRVRWAGSGVCIAVDLKSAEGVEVVRRLTSEADVFVEGFRPGVMERLGLGPDDLRAGNPRLVYARMTGWGQDGPWADRAGHDINYLAWPGRWRTSVDTTSRRRHP